MNFKAYDILSSLIPGFIMLIVLIPFLGLEYNKDYVIGYTAIGFLLGYVLNTLGSWLEGFYYLTWGGKPSDKLLDGKSIWKIKIYNHSSIKAHLQTKTQNIYASNDELFSIALRISFSQKDTRLEDFSNIYAFSRTMLTCVLLSSIILITNYYDDWKVYLSILIVIVFWYRSKQRGYYLCKEILNIYSSKENL